MARIAGPHSLPQRQTDASCSIRCCLNRSPPRTSRSGGAARERLTSASKLRGEESCQQPSACGKSSQHLDQAYPLAVQDGRTLVVAVSFLCLFTEIALPRDMMMVALLSHRFSLRFKIPTFRSKQRKALSSADRKTADVRRISGNIE